MLGLCFMIFSRIFGFIFYSLIFHSTLMKYLPMYRDMHSPHWIFLTLFEFVIGFILCYVYYYFKKYKADLCPFAFSIGFFVVSRFSLEIANYFMFPYSALLMLSGMLAGFFSFVSAGGVLYIMDKKMLAK